MQPDTTIGHYQILKPLGAGAMGEVYLAEDTRLKRQVAIKVLPERLRSDEARLKRFRREAEAAATLNHPNIATIFALEEMDGPDGSLMFITMEYVEGSSLNELIPDGGMDIDQFFSLFIPLSNALSHAHQQGRIHRDLKPANIVVAEDGTPKILDFGLARIIDPDPVRAYSDTESDLGEEDETLTVQEQGIPSLTRAGQLVGTPQYMSPEQAEREDTDARTDIFSFGVVMYEAITGQKPFEGKTLESIIGKIMEAEPKSISEIKPITPYSLGTLIRSCLRKDREERVQNARMLHADLRDIQGEVQAGTVLVDASTVPDPVLEPAQSESVPFWRQPAGIVTMIALALVIGLASAWLITPIPDLPLRKFQWEVATMDRGGNASISPDGSMIAYVAGGRLFIRNVDALSSREVTDSEGILFYPFWSPNSDAVGYFTNSELRTVSVQRGFSRTVCQLPHRTAMHGSWDQDGTILFDQFAFGLYSVPAKGGTPSVILEPDSTSGETAIAHQFRLPDNQGLLYIAYRSDMEGRTVIMLQSGESTRRLLDFPDEFVFSPVYSPSGHILFNRWSQGKYELWAAPFSLSSLTLTGESFPVGSAEHRVSLSIDGTMVYRSVEAGGQRQLVWVDRTGQVTGTIGQTQELLAGPALSPDESHVAVNVVERGQSDIWVHDIKLGTKIRLTFDAFFDRFTAWSPDGTEVAFTSTRNGNADIFKKRADGIGSIEPLVAGPKFHAYPGWSHDGRYLVYSSDERGINDIWKMSLEGNQERSPLMETQHFERSPALSPNGRYVAYQSNETGYDEVYVMSFPDGGSKWPVGRGQAAKWNGNGTELYFVSEGTMMAVEVSTKDVFRPGIPKPLFTDKQVKVDNLAYSYDVSADGNRFVVPQDVDVGETPTITVVQNWYAEFKDRE
jgi:eukaryotic-like serine/threonine-protein kinase